MMDMKHTTACVSIKADKTAELVQSVIIFSVFFCGPLILPNACHIDHTEPDVKSNLLEMIFINIPLMDFQAVF